MTDTDQSPKHDFTDEERSRGGRATKVNHLIHGKYAKVMKQAYICIHCGNAVSAGTIMEQDALMGMLSSKQGLYEAIKRNLIFMEKLCEEQSENPKDTFIMLQQINSQLIKLWERCPDAKDNDWLTMQTSDAYFHKFI